MTRKETSRHIDLSDGETLFIGSHNSRYQDWINLAIWGRTKKTKHRGSITKENARLLIAALEEAIANAGSEKESPP